MGDLGLEVMVYSLRPQSLQKNNVRNVCFAILCTLWPLTTGVPLKGMTTSDDMSYGLPCQFGEQRGFLCLLVFEWAWLREHGHYSGGLMSGLLINYMDPLPHSPLMASIFVTSTRGMNYPPQMNPGQHFPCRV